MGRFQNTRKRVKNSLTNFYRALTNLPRWLNATVKRKPFHRKMRVKEEEERKGSLKKKRSERRQVLAQPAFLHRSLIQENLNNLRMVNPNALVPPEVGDKGAYCMILKGAHEDALEDFFRQTGTNRRQKNRLSSPYKVTYNSLQCDTYLRNNPLNTSLPTIGNVISSETPEETHARESAILNQLRSEANQRLRRSINRRSTRRSSLPAAVEEVSNENE